MFAKLKREEQKKEANRRQNMCNTYTLRGLKMRILTELERPPQTG